MSEVKCNLAFKKNLAYVMHYISSPLIVSYSHMLCFGSSSPSLISSKRRGSKQVMGEVPVFIFYLKEKAS